MSDNCLLCASDEGVFVDVGQQPVLKEKADNCRLGKVAEGPSSKLCHKCTFEIEQCNAFVGKVKESSDSSAPDKAYCVLCFESCNKDIFFDLAKQKTGVESIVQRIRELFTDELKDRELQEQLICLSCRYCVDLLTDLRNLSDEVSGKLKSIIKNGINPADLPKTKTTIVNRKTTFVQSSNLELNTPSDTDSESCSVMGSRKKVNKVNKSLNSKLEQKGQKCQKCKSLVSTGNDLYRIHQSGTTVCKECWLAIDPSKSPSKKRKKIVYPKTKLCSILLQDENQVNPDYVKKLIEKSEKRRSTTISESENQVKTKSRTNRTSVAKKNKESVITADEDENENEEGKDDEAKLTRGNKKKQGNLEPNEQGVEVKAKRTSRKRKDSEQSVEEDIETKSLRGNRTQIESEQSVHEEIQSIRPTRTKKGSLQNVEVKSTRVTRKRKESEQSIPEEVEKISTVSRRTRKNSELSASGDIKSTKVARGRKDSEQSIHEEIEINVDVDSDNGPVLKRAKSSVTESVTKKISKSKANSQIRSSSRKRGRTSSLESSSSVRKSARNAKKNTTQDFDGIIEIDDDSEPDESIAHASKKSRKDKETTDDDDVHSDTEKKSVSASSKESTPSRKFKTPTAKESTSHGKGSKANKVSKVTIQDTSESEEIDVLKSTDEESKVDTETEEKDNPSTFQTEDASKSDDNNEQKSDELKADDNNESKSDDTIETKSDNDESKSEKNSSKEPGCEVEQIETNVENQDDNDKNVQLENEESKSVEESIEPVISKIVQEVDLEENQVREENQVGEENQEYEENQVNEENQVREENQVNSANENEAQDIISVHDLSKDDLEKNDLDDIRNENIEAENVSDSVKDDKSPSSRRSSLSSSKKSKSVGKKRSKKAEIESVPDVIIDDSDSDVKNVEEELQTIYSCAICDKVYDSKFIGLQHELTHSKSLEIKLQKVQPVETIKESDEEHEIDTNDSEEKMSVDGEEQVENENPETMLDDKDEKFAKIDQVADDEGKQESQEFNKEASEEKKNEVLELSDGKQDLENEKENQEVEENDTNKNDSGSIKNDDQEVENEVAKTSRRSRRFSKKLDEQPSRITRGKRRTINETLGEKEVSMEIDLVSEKVCENVPDIIDEISELPETEQEKCSTKDRKDEDENVESTTSDANKAEFEIEQIDEDDGQEQEQERDTAAVEVIECDLENDEAEVEEITPIVDLEDEASKEILDLEDRNSKITETVVITEIENTEAEPISLEDDVEQIDLTENDDCQASRADNGVEVDISSTDKNVTVDNEVTDDANQNQNEVDVVEVNNEEENTTEENTTEDEVLLAQESFDDILQRKNLLVVDEVVESVTEGDEDSEREANASLEKDNSNSKSTELEIKMTDAESTDVLEVNDKSISNKKNAEDSIVGEKQIIQDMDVVEEVIHDQDNHQSNTDVIQEEENNGNCLDIGNKIVGEVLAEVFNAATMDGITPLGLQTEPISDDEMSFPQETAQSIPKVVRRSHDMPSLDPIDDE